jgi:S-phase kinase-associated protein 1
MDILHKIEKTIILQGEKKTLLNSFKLTSLEGRDISISELACENSTVLSKLIKEKNPKLDFKEINYETLEIVIIYLEHYKNKKLGDNQIVPLNDKPYTEAFEDFERNLIEDKSFEIIFDLANAAEILGIESLHNLSCAKIADFMKGKTTEEISKTFTIECLIPEDAYNAINANQK